MAAPKLRFAAIGLDHRHIYEQVGRLLERGCECAGWWTEGEPQPLEGFRRRFPDLPRVQDKRRLLEDSSIALVVTAGIPSERAGIAVEAMRHGKDVMSDKPGCTSLAQLLELKRTVAETGRIWSVNGRTFAWERGFSKADLKRYGDETPPDGPIVAVKTADLGEKEAILGAGPAGFFTIPHFNGFPGFLIALRVVARPALREAVVDAWLAAAPATLAEQYLKRRRR